MVSIKSVREIIELAKEYDLGRLDVRMDEHSFISVRAKETQTVVNAPAVKVAHSSTSEANETTESKHFDAKVLVSPLIGTVYLAPSPGESTFVQEGQRVAKGQTLCLVEAMKTFNKIEAEKDAVVRKILVKDGESVDCAQGLFELESV